MGTSTPDEQMELAILFHYSEAAAARVPRSRMEKIPVEFGWELILWAMDAVGFAYDQTEKGQHSLARWKMIKKLLQLVTQPKRTGGQATR